ncbi:hypothetical protein MRB53_030855 [Persea americana]|uniref:Uncharacterized protein n=1 Tax=Persea americana TaxID=3435 RepID=A0ACC2KMP5_PERAE|nr:hypothetical protein MRB53_030855 [Persea americana]
MGAIRATVTFGCFTSLVLLCFSSPCFHAAKSSITNDRPLDIGETMSSPNQTFELGFMSKSTISSTTIWYLGIWSFYFEQRLVVWIAKKKNPVSNASPSLKINHSGNLIISSADGTEIPITSVAPISKNTSAKLLESGNLVLLEEAGGRVLWQSFDHPPDTLLPDMKLWQNLFLISGLIDEIPYLGPFTLGINPNGTNQFVVWYRGLIYWKSSLWNSLGSIKGLFGINIHYSFEFDEDGKYFNFAYNQTRG